MSKKLLWAASAAVLLHASPALAGTDADIQALRAEIQAMKQMYEQKIDTLEDRIDSLQHVTKAQNVASVEPSAGPIETASVPATATRQTGDNSFNPAVSVILNGRYGSFSERDSELAGFAIGEETERPEEGLSIDETELNFSASVDDKFRGSATIALHEHDGEGVEIEIEEAYLETIALPHGVQAKAGRFFSDIGYLNSHHTHEDDFVDRPLPSRAFLNKAYNDDGVEVSWILPTDLYSEIGGSILQGDDFPAGGGDGSDFGSWTAYGRIGGDIGENTAWRAGVSTLQASGVERSANEDLVLFEGDSDLYIADARVVWAPTGNNHEEEVIVQGEYFIRNEDGSYDDTDAGTGAVFYDDRQTGWYAQGVYKFHPQWRAGLRYSALDSGNIPDALAGSALDADGHDPWNASGMIDWSNSEFSRLRLQFSREELANDLDDNQVMLQYIMSIGAHGAHAF
ncbi:MAG: hypothetical protein H6869_08890 [Rhodospirillales bacterium]|nr:hypothetical protein [Rhodospirillales bacterium]